MIQIKESKDCCGCSACVQKCPRQCISMYEDEEGFLYPLIDVTLCIDCSLCEKVCPELQQSDIRSPKATYAAKNPDKNIRRQSSSGGVFTLLAEKIISEGGVVFGAKFNKKWEVVHDYVETVEGLAAFRGSKYVQSQIGESYKQTETFLKHGRSVLFSGTPCQIAALRLFLHKVYDNLLLVDFICHGVPSPGVFRQYLKEEIEEFAHQGDGKNSVSSHPKSFFSERDGLIGEDFLNVEAISFRDKKLGWKKFSFALILSKASAAGEKNTVSLSYTLDKHPFLRGYLHNLYLRPCCHFCPVRELKSGSDITLGDYWGIDSIMPELDDDQGVSAVTVNTEKGYLALHSTTVVLWSSSWTDLCQRNPSLMRSAVALDCRAAFFANNGMTFHKKIEALCRPTFRMRLLIIVRTLLGKRGITVVKKMLVKHNLMNYITK